MLRQPLSQRLSAVRRTIIGMFVLVAVWSVALGAQVTTPATSTVKKATVLKAIDINSASAAVMAGLGIDSATVQKIIAGRPYHRKGDLLSQKLLTADQYNKVKGQIVARQKKG